MLVDYHSSINNYKPVPLSDIQSGFKKIVSDCSRNNYRKWVTILFYLDTEQADSGVQILVTLGN